ncbi:hypothetical protein D3C86_1427740 [compost metagenome]
MSSEGCNFLIKTNRAGLVSHARDLADYLGWEICKEEKPDSIAEFPDGMTVEEQRILQILKNSTLAIDELALCSELPKSKLALHLLNLEMKGILIALPGKVYQLSQDISCLPIK